MNDDQELFGEIGAGDRVRKPERWNTKQWAVVVAGLALLTLGGLVVIAAYALLASGEIRIISGVPGAGLCAAGYYVYRKHWSLRDRQ